MYNHHDDLSKKQKPYIESEPKDVIEGSEKGFAYIISYIFYLWAQSSYVKSKRTR